MRSMVQVYDAAVQAVGRDAPAVEQDQRGVAALAAQVGAGGAVVAARGAVHHVGVRGQVVQAGAVDRQVQDHLLDAGDAQPLKLRGRDHLHRQRSLAGDALDARAGDGDAFGGLRERRAGQAGQGQCSSQGGGFEGHAGESSVRGVFVMPWGGAGNPG
jgi:hypothetical protein